MPLAIYCRVSTPAQALNTSYASQQRQGVEFAQLLGEAEYIIYKDVFTGTKAAGRNDWLRLIRDVELGKIDKVVYFSLDRLARNTIEGLQFLDRLSARDIRLYKYGAGEINYTDPDVRLLLTVEFGFAEREAKKIKERTYKGKKDSINDGCHRYRELYGYRITDEHDKATGKRIWIKDEDEVKAVLFIYQCVIEDKLPLRRICKRLTELGYKPRKAIAWNPTSVSHILHQPAYCGMMYDTRGELVVGKVYEAIMTFDAWQQAQTLYTPCITSKNRNGYAVKHQATNIIKCKHCGAPYQINEGKTKYHYKSRPGQVRVTHRIAYAHDTSSPCNQSPKYLNYNLINWIVEHVYIMALTHSADSMLDDMLAKINDAQSGKHDDIERLRRSIATLEAEISNFNIAIAKGLDMEGAIKEINTRKNKISIFRETVDGLEKEIELANKNYKAIKAEFAMGKLIDYLKADNRGKRDMVKALIANATIEGREIVFTLIDGRVYSYNYQIMNQNKEQYRGVNPDIYVLVANIIASSPDEGTKREADKALEKLDTVMREQGRLLHH